MLTIRTLTDDTFFCFHLFEQLATTTYVEMSVIALVYLSDVDIINTNQTKQHQKTSVPLLILHIVTPPKNK
jgi:hypothetical protein